MRNGIESPQKIPKGPIERNDEMVEVRKQGCQADRATVASGTQAFTSSWERADTVGIPQAAILHFSLYGDPWLCDFATLPIKR